MADAGITAIAGTKSHVVDLQSTRPTSDEPHGVTCDIVMDGRGSLKPCVNGMLPQSVVSGYHTIKQQQQQLNNTHANSHDAAARQVPGFNLFHTLATVAAAATHSPVPAGCDKAVVPCESNHGSKQQDVSTGVRGHGDSDGSGKRVESLPPRPRSTSAAHSVQSVDSAVVDGVGGMVGGSPASRGAVGPAPPVGSAANNTNHLVVQEEEESHTPTIQHCASGIEQLLLARTHTPPILTPTTRDDAGDDAVKVAVVSARPHRFNAAGVASASAGKAAMSPLSSPLTAGVATNNTARVRGGFGSQLRPLRRSTRHVQQVLTAQGSRKAAAVPAPVAQPPRSRTNTRRKSSTASTKRSKGGGRGRGVKRGSRGAKRDSGSKGDAKAAAGSDGSLVCPVCYQQRRRLSIFYQSRVQVCVACKDFFRRMVRKVRSDATVQDSDEELQSTSHAGDPASPDALRCSDIAERFPRLVRCLDGGMDPYMVGVRQYTWRDPVRRALYADKNNKARAKAKQRLKSKLKQQGGSKGVAVQHRNVGTTERQGVPSSPHPPPGMWGSQSYQAQLNSASTTRRPMHSRRGSRGSGRNGRKRKCPPDHGIATSTPHHDVHAGTSAGQHINPVLLSAVGHLATGAAASGAGANTAPPHNPNIVVTNRVESPPTNTADVDVANRPSCVGCLALVGEHGAAGPPPPPVHAGALEPIPAEDFLVRAGVLRAAVPAALTPGDTEGDNVAWQCRVVGCTGKHRESGDETRHAGALCEYHVPSTAHTQGGEGDRPGKTFVATVAVPSTGVSAPAYVQACGWGHATVWKWVNEFRALDQRDSPTFDGIPPAPTGWPRSSLCLWCERHPTPLHSLHHSHSNTLGAASQRSGGGGGGAMWGSPVPHQPATAAHLKRGLTPTSAPVDAVTRSGSGTGSAAHPTAPPSVPIATRTRQHSAQRVQRSGDGGSDGGGDDGAPRFGPFAPAVGVARSHSGASTSSADSLSARVGIPAHPHPRPSVRYASSTSSGSGPDHPDGGSVSGGSVSSGTGSAGRGSLSGSLSGGSKLARQALRLGLLHPVHLLLHVDDQIIGGLEVTAHHTLAQCREMIAEELDNPPRHYLFQYKGAPVARKQEARRRAVASHCGGGRLVLLPQPHVTTPPRDVSYDSGAALHAHASVVAVHGAMPIKQGGGEKSNGTKVLPMSQPSPKKRPRVGPFTFGSGARS